MTNNQTINSCVSSCQAANIEQIRLVYQPPQLLILCSRETGSGNTNVSENNNGLLS